MSNKSVSYLCQGLELPADDDEVFGFTIYFNHNGEVGALIGVDLFVPGSQDHLIYIPAYALNESTLMAVVAHLKANEDKWIAASRV